MTVSTTNKKMIKGATAQEIKVFKTGVFNMGKLNELTKNKVKLNSASELKKQPITPTFLDALTTVQRAKVIKNVAIDYSAIGATNYTCYRDMAYIVGSQHRANTMFMSAKDSRKKIADSDIGKCLVSSFGLPSDKLDGEISALITLANNPKLMDNLQINAKSKKPIALANGRRVAVLNFNSAKAFAENCRSLGMAQSGNTKGDKANARNTIKKGTYEYMLNAIKAFKETNTFPSHTDFETKVDTAKNSVWKKPVSLTVSK